MKRALKGALGGLAALTASTFLAAAPSHADPNPYLGDVMPVGFNFCPRGWIPAQGQLLPIAQNTALFSLLGTTYGGDGRTTFAVPDTRSRVIVGQGTGAGLTPWPQSQRGGTESVILDITHLPAHTHRVNLVSQSATLRNTAVGSMIYTRTNGDEDAFSNTIASAGPFGVDALTMTGNNQAIDVRSPTLAILFCVATQGVFPSRP